jgi:hypothetical protein
MPQIAITNSKKRDATVAAESVRVSLRVQWVDAEERRAKSTKLMKGTLDRDFGALLQKFGTPEQVGDELIANDPEIDLESVGRMLRETSRVFVNSDRQVVYGVKQVEIIRNPDGSEKARRPKEMSTPNVSAEVPLLWSGRLMPKVEVCQKFVMINKLQLKHVNGLTYDFLFDIAKELEAKQSMLRLGAGPKSNLPLILRRGASKYQGFLEGRTQGTKYMLLLHLSKIELKAPEEPKESTEVTQP